MIMNATLVCRYCGATLDVTLRVAPRSKLTTQGYRTELTARVTPSVHICPDTAQEQLLVPESDGGATAGGSPLVSGSQARTQDQTQAEAT